jgi:hypothetical protein
MIIKKYPTKTNPSIKSSKKLSLFKLPLKDVLKKKKIIESVPNLQTMYKPFLDRTKTVSHKPTNIIFLDKNSSDYKERTLDFKKKEIAAKIH